MKQIRVIRPIRAIRVQKCSTRARRPATSSPSARTGTFTLISNGVSGQPLTRPLTDGGNRSILT
jgi:hypothetical protein